MAFAAYSRPIVTTTTKGNIMTKRTVTDFAYATAGLAAIAIPVVLPTIVVELVNRKYGRPAAFATAVGFYAVNEIMIRANDAAFVAKLSNAYDSMTRK